MKTVQVERAQLEQWLQAFKKIHDDKHSHWDVDEEISAIEKALEPIAMDVMKSDEADFWRWWKPYQLKDCWRLELVARDAWMASKATLKPKEPEQEPVAWGEIEAIANKRYKVVQSHDSMFYRYAVVAGDGTRQVYLGREVECENMARKFAGAFLDGAFAMKNYTTPPQRTWVGLTPQERDEINEQVYGAVPHHVAFHHAIEVKLKEKNT